MLLVVVSQNSFTIYIHVFSNSFESCPLSPRTIMKKVGSLLSVIHVLQTVSRLVASNMSRTAVQSKSKPVPPYGIHSLCCTLPAVHALTKQLHLADSTDCTDTRSPSSVQVVLALYKPNINYKHNRHLISINPMRLSPLRRRTPRMHSIPLECRTQEPPRTPKVSGRLSPLALALLREP